MGRLLAGINAHAYRVGRRRWVELTTLPLDVLRTEVA